MSVALADAGSFRDPGGRVFTVGERILRAVLPSSAGAYEAARDAGALTAFSDQGLLLPSRETEAGTLADTVPNSAYVLEHPRVPFISYPYEWSFSLHRRAALLQLDLHLEALERGFTLSDATAYNVQFNGTKPVFIDHLSLRPYREGELWTAHRQFCMQFLNPLLMWTLLGLQPNHWFRGSLEGVAPEDLAPLLSLKHKLSWTVLTHVTAQAALHRRTLKSDDPTDRLREAKLPPSALKGMLSSLRSYIAGLQLPAGPTVWGTYDNNNSYADAEAAAKRRFVGEMTAAVRPRLMFDFGCNSGDYSQVALDNGADYVVGFDYDHGALEKAYARFDASGRSFLPLWFDAANPSPSQGWAQRERKGLAERANADALVALAFIHHIVIGRNVPLDMTLDWLIRSAPVGVIEFPPKSDPMVKRLLALREDIFPDYCEETFLALVGKRARIVRTEHLSEGGRLLVWYDRTTAA